MTLDELRSHQMGRLNSDVKQARRQVVQKLTELIVASADALEVENEKRSRSWDALSIQPRPPDLDADPGLIREFVHTPVYKWVTNDYISGSSTEHVISRIAEILHELAPGVFRRPRY